MATNPLYLNTLPSTEKEPSVKLTVVNSKGQSNSNVSLSELMSQMCAMVQLLHLVEGELALNQTKMAAMNNTVAQINVDAVTAEGNQAVANAEKAMQAAEKPWWEKLLIAVFAIVMVALSYATFGITGAILAVVTLLVTTVPLPFLGGKTLTGYIASKIAGALGKDFGWSQAKIQEVTGYVNLAIGVALAFASFGAGAFAAFAEAAEVVATVVEDVVEDVIEMTEMAGGSQVSTVVENVVDNVIEDTAEAAAAASKSGKAVKLGFSAFSAVNAFTSQTVSSNCISDIMMGTLMSSNPNASTKEKEVIAGIAAALSILVAIFGALLGGKFAISSIGEDLEEGSTLISKLGRSAKYLIGTVATANGAGQGGLGIYEGTVNIDIAQLIAAVTRLTGDLKSSEQIGHLINQTISQINTLMKDFADEYKALESGLKNIGLYDRAEVTALLQANQQA